MDQFYREVNCVIYLKWIQLQDLPNITMQAKKDEVCLLSDHSLGRITLYPDSIIEEEVKDRESGKVIFYIHFRMANMKHAVSLFEEMIDCIYENCAQPLGKILLCCSGGLTTSYFASQMQALADLEHLNYVIDATGYGMLYEMERDYDVVLLAPQVSYMLPKIRANIPSQIVEQIPTKYFARNDYKHALDYALSLLKGGEGHEHSGQ